MLNNSPFAKMKNSSLSAASQLHWPKANDESWRKSPLRNFSLDDLFWLPLTETKKWQGDSPDINAIHEILIKDFIPADLTIILWHEKYLIYDHKRSDTEHIDIQLHTPNKFIHLWGQGHDFLPPDTDDPLHFFGYKDRLAALELSYAPALLQITCNKNQAANSLIRIVHTTSSKQAISLPLVIINAKAKSSLSIVEEYIHDPCQYVPNENLNGILSMTKIIAGNESRVHYYGLQNLNQKWFSLNRIALDIAERAKVEIGLSQLGGKFCAWQSRVNLAKSHANFIQHGFGLADSSRHIDMQADIEHNAPNTHSQLFYKCSVSDRSSSNFIGLLRMAKNAAFSSGNQVNHNMTLSPKAKAYTTPKLEIMVDEVQCSHGASLGDINKEQLFYLQNRGLSQKQAERTIIEGFFTDVINLTQIPRLKGYLKDKVFAKLDQAGV